MSSNKLGSIYATTISSEKYIIINSQNIELSGNVIMKQDVTINNGLLNSNSVIPNVTNSASLGSTTNLWSNAYITNISVSNISISGTITLPANSINSSHIQTGTILGQDISDLNITEGKIGALAVTEGKIGALAVTDAKIATGTISLGKLSAGAITSLTTPTANSINSSHIIDGAILGTDISNRTITASNIAIGTITNFEILDGAITGAKIGSSTIEGGNIAAGTITSSNILDGTITGTDIVSGTITSSNILDGTITGTDIASGTITSSNILDGTITGTDIASGTITSSNILDGTITGTDIASGTITSSNILDGTITGTDIASGTITSSNILDGTITGTDIASGTITSSNILDGTILGQDISDLNITDAKIATGTISLGKLSAACISSLTTSGAPGPNSIDSSHIINRSIVAEDIALGTIKGENIALGTIKGDNIEDGTITGTDIQSGTITSTQLSSALTNQLASLQASMNYLLANAVIMSADTIFIGTGSGPTQWLNIPINLVANESVEVNIQFKFTGNYINNEVYLLYTIGNNHYNFSEWRCTGTYQSANPTGWDSGYPNTGGSLVFRSVETLDLDCVLNFKINKVIDNVGTYKRHYIIGTGVYCYSGIGTCRVEYAGMAETNGNLNLVPTGIRIYHGYGYAMKARYHTISNPI